MTINKFRFLFLIIVIFFITVYSLSSPSGIYGKEPTFSKQNAKISNRGVWVTCFSEKRVIYSKEAVLELIEFCKKANVNEIYLQLYRACQAYYDSTVGDRKKYEEIIKIERGDKIDLLLKEAKNNKIKVFAWINVLSIGQNKKADIISKFGDSVLTKDQYLRPSIRNENINESDKYYLRDEQLFLEAGDPRVVKYILSIVNEIITRYPAISGVHLDYIRYPYCIPFLPDSRFNKYGLSYGYGENNIVGFKEKTGIDPLSLKDEKDKFLQWDNWKRGQITTLVEKISKCIRSKSPNLLISCAVVPSPEKAYSVAFQDWPFWLEKGIVDYVFLMNYTRDNRLYKEIVKSALSHRGLGKIFVGIGFFLIKDEPELFFEQYKVLSDLKPDGVIFFSYDDISNKEEIIANLLSQ